MNILVVGSSANVHEIVAQATREFDALLLALYEMDTLFGKDENHEVGPATCIGLWGAVCLIEPDRFDKTMQIGFLLSNTVNAGMEALQLASQRSLRDATSGLAAV